MMPKSHEYIFLNTCAVQWRLTPKQLETHGCVFSIVATDELVLKHQIISAHIADKIIIASDQCHTEILHL